MSIGSLLSHCTQFSSKQSFHKKLGKIGELQVESPFGKCVLGKNYNAESPVLMNGIMRRQFPRNYKKVQDKSNGELLHLVADDEAITILKSEIKRLKEERKELIMKLSKSRGVSKELMNMIRNNGLLAEEQSIFSLFKDVLSFLIK